MVSVALSAASKNRRIQAQERQQQPHYWPPTLQCYYKRQKRPLMGLYVYLASFLLLCGWSALRNNRFQNLVMVNNTKINISQLPTLTSSVLLHHHHHQQQQSQQQATVNSVASFAASARTAAINNEPPSSPAAASDDDEEAPHVVFNDLKYRRVCAQVFHSVLCMMIRYPFDVPLQDPTVPYPKPVDDRFYQNNLRGRLMFVDGAAMEDCQRRFPKNVSYNNITTTIYNRNSSSSSSSSSNDNNNNATADSVRRFYNCMEYVSTLYPDIVLAMFTRRRRRQQQQANAKATDYDDDNDDEEEEEWYGITTPSKKLQQKQRTQSFFRNQLIVVLGASPTMPIVNCLVTIFGKCQCHDQFLYTCGSKHKKNRNQQEQTNDAIFNDQNNGRITLQIVRYEPVEYKPNLTDIIDDDNARLSHHLRHIVNDTEPLLQVLQSPLHNISQHRFLVNNPNHSMTSNIMSSRLRPLTVIVEYPIAHMQTHDMLIHYPEQVDYNQKGYIQLVMNITTPAARQELRDMGFDLQRLIVWDGVPHHFPTSTGAFAEHIATTRNRSTFLQHLYPGWHPDYGSTCRGPLPPTSKMTQILKQSRQLWQDHYYNDNNINDGNPYDQHPFLQQRWYAPLWEFSNQFWWQEIMWSTSANPRLDCLHTFKQKTGMTCVHKYFLQAMIDGYYEEVAATTGAAAAAAAAKEPTT